MNDDMKSDLKKLVCDAESKIVKSVLGWKHKKEGRQIPDDILERESRRIAGQAREVLRKRGKSVWDEIRSAVMDGDSKKKGQ